MAGMYPDWLAAGDTGGGLFGNTFAALADAAPAPPAWFASTIANLQHGGLPMLTGEPYGRFPMQAAPAPQQQRPEQTQSTPAAQPTIVGAIPQSSGGAMARDQGVEEGPSARAMDGRERPYPPSAFNNLPVPSLPALSLPPLSAIGDHLNAGLMGFAHGSAPLPAIANLISGLITGQRADPEGVALAQQDRAQRAAAQAAQPTIGAIAQSSGGATAREDGRERPYPPSAFNNLPVPSLPAPSVPPLSAIGDRLNAGLMGFAHGSAPLPAIANLISGLVTGQRADPRGVALAQQDRAQRAATQYLAGAQDIEPNLKAAMIANPALTAQYLLARAKPPAIPLAPTIRLR
jgi:hypothetical protein